MIDPRTIALFLGASILSFLVAQPTLAAPGTPGSCVGTDAVAVSAAYFTADNVCYGPYAQDTVVSVNDTDCYWVQVSDSTITVTSVGPASACPEVSHVDGLATSAPAQVAAPPPPLTDLQAPG